LPWVIYRAGADMGSACDPGAGPGPDPRESARAVHHVASWLRITSHTSHTTPHSGFLRILNVLHINNRPLKTSLSYAK
jgi:hypothetical protein